MDAATSGSSQGDLRSSAPTGRPSARPPALVQLVAARRQHERACCERCKREPELLAELRAPRVHEEGMARQLEAAQRTEAETTAALITQRGALPVGEGDALATIRC